MSVQQHNVQQLSVAANLAAVEQSGDALKDEALQDARSEKTKPTESITKQLLEATGKKAGTQVLAGLMAKLGDTFTPKKILNKMEREYGSLFENKEDFSDKVNLKSLQSQRAKALKNNLAQQARDEASPAKNGMREYLQTYTQFLVSGGTELKKKINKQEQKLLREGKVKVKDLNQFRSQAAKSVRGEILKQVKRAFYKQLFAAGKLEKFLGRFGTQKVLDWASFNHKIGGYDFGGERGQLEGAFHEMVKQVGEETKDFIQEELTTNFIKKQISQDGKNVEKEIGELMKLGKNVGFDFEGLIKTLPKLALDQGLAPIIDNGVAAQASMEQGEGERRGYQYDSEEEKDILMERIRILYMKRAIYGDWKTNLELSVRMLKTRNGLIKLGLKMEDFSRVEKEGKELAKLKLIQMLREGFEERATYAKLSGPAWKMTEKKTKTILKNLDKLGVGLSDKDLEYMRDKANEKMFAEAEHELSLIETALEVRETAYLTQKRKLALQILERLSKESNIPWNRMEKNSIIEAV